MTADAPDEARSDAVRASNDQLDERLRELAAQIPADLLHADPGGDEWTLTQNLAHVAEFSRYFSVDLAAQLKQEGTAVGRTHEHADRLAAVAAAEGQGLDELRGALDAALDVLAAQLAELRDEHLDRLAHNRKYGPDPLTKFLDRYVLGHKAAHIQQLEKTIEAAVQRRP